jgi:hypothetical protein
LPLAESESQASGPNLAAIVLKASQIGSGYNSSLYKDAGQGSGHARPADAPP